jgi:uncharacterized membrane protein YeiB
MWKFLEAVKAIHVLLVFVAAIAFFGFWIRTRFWFPRYAHYLGLFALLLGLSMLLMVPEDAPINQDEWGLLKKALMILVFPGLVYFFFVFYGGQKAAYERERLGKAVFCPYCGAERNTDLEGHCAGCGQTIA